MSAGARNVRETVVRWLADRYGIAPRDVPDDRPLAELGLTSRDAAALAARLSEVTGNRLPVTLMWEAPTLGALVSRLARPAGGEAPRREERVLRAAGAERPGDRSVPVAVVGVGCRFPGAESPGAFWRLLREGRDAVGTLPDGRWDAFAPDADGPGVLGELPRHGGFLTDVAGFDAEFFGIAAHEAAAMDPQQRMLLEVAREALDHAALSVSGLEGSRTGVFVGASGNEYAYLTTADLASVDAWTAPGSALSVLAGRLSYLLDLRGPSLAVDTACSSSLVAVHHAVRSLACGESDTALAAGVNLLLSPAVTLGFRRMGALSPTGRCRAFDAAADGMVRGEGCGVVVLKRLADAERDGDRVLAVITGTAVNSDGRSAGLTAPSPEAQRAVLAAAHSSPATVDYVEAHGTGTPLGDPIEASALGSVLGAGRAPGQPLLIGSVKTNIGHLEAAAGIAGLIKTVLALHHGEIPGQLHFTAPGPHIDPGALGLRVVTASEPWPRCSGTATAGVSSFGFSGTNAHVALAEHRPPEPVTAPPAAPTGSERPAILLADAPTGDRLHAYAGELADWLGTPAGRRVRPGDLGRTLAGRTGRGRHRVAVLARDRSEAAGALARYAAGEPDARLVAGCGTPGGPGPVWVFSGYGSQWPGMAHRLLEAEPAFAAAVDRLEPLLLEHAGVGLRAGLRPDAAAARPDAPPDAVMPLLYGIQVALAELWRSYGLRPAAVIGHSLGEIAAAVAAGALDPADGARIVAVRSRLLSRLRGGAMAVVERSGAQVAGLAREFPSLRTAVHASPVQSVVTGREADVAGLVARVTAGGGFARRLPVTVAGHSADVDPLLEEFARELGPVRHGRPGCRRYSTVLDDPCADGPYDTAYWVANLRRPVRFEQAVRVAARDGHRVFVEVAPHGTQLHPVTETLRAEGVDDALVVPTLRRETDDALSFRTALATLLVHGVPVPEARELLHPGGRIADVPPPRWRHRRFWAGEEPGPHAPPSRSPGAPSTGPAAGTAAGATALDRLRVLVAGVMGYGAERLDPDRPLTELGLDSLTAARVRTAVEREFGVDLEPGRLLRRGTLRAVARTLPERAASGPAAAGPEAGPAEEPAPVPRSPRGVPGPLLRAFPGDGPGAPLFLAHAAGGSCEVYGPLAARLDGRRPVFGFDRLDAPDDVPGRAAEFADRVRGARPKGPWLVGGWSYGGLVAQEAARLLAPHGTVAALVLFDSVLPLPAPPGLTALRQARRRFEDFAAYIGRTYGTVPPLPYEDLAGLDDAGQIDLVLKVLEQNVDLPEAAVAHQRASYLDLRSGERHTPGPHAGRTLLYRATEPAPHTVRDPRYERDDHTLGWDAHCPDLTVTPLPGHHLALLDPPAVDTLAGLLDRDLRGH